MSRQIVEIQDPDGEVIGYTSRAKALKYRHRGRADFVSKFAIRFHRAAAVTEIAQERKNAGISPPVLHRARLAVVHSFIPAAEDFRGFAHYPLPDLRTKVRKAA